MSSSLTGHVVLFQSARHTVAFLKKRQSTHHSPATYSVRDPTGVNQKEWISAEEQKKAAKRVRLEKSVWVLKELPE